MTKQEFLRLAHRFPVAAALKGFVVHVDLVSGIGKDRAGIQYLHQIGVDAIITSRSQLVAAGHAEGVVTIQRLLLVDDSALETGVRTIARAAPDIVEVLPGIIFPEIAARSFYCWWFYPQCYRSCSYSCSRRHTEQQ